MNALNLFEIPMLNRRSGFNVYLSSLLDKEGKTANILVKIVITNDTIIIIHKLVVKLHVIWTKGNNDRYFERYFATRVIMDIILPPW